MKIIKGEVVFTKKDLLSFLVKLARDLRTEGLTIGTSELEAATRLIENYCALLGKISTEEHKYILGYNELMDLLKASLLKHNNFENIFEEIVRENLVPYSMVKTKVSREIEAYLKDLGLRFGEKVSFAKMRKIIRKRSGREKVFETLSKIGVIVKNRKHGFYEVLDEKSVEKLLSKNISLLRSVRNIEELANTLAYRKLEKTSISKIYDEKDFYLNTIETAITYKADLSRISMNKLVNLSKIAYLKKRKSLLRKISKIIADRILRNSGELKDVDEEILVDVLEKANALTPEIIEAIVKGKPRAAEKLLKKHRKVVIASIANIEDIEAQKIIASKALKLKLKREDIEALIDGLKPEALTVLEKCKCKELSRSEIVLVKAVSKLAKAFEYFRKAHLEDNKGYLDMAYGMLSDYNSLMSEYARISKKRKSNIEKKILGKAETLNMLITVATSDKPVLPSKITASPTIETLYVLKELYDASLNPKVKEKILSIASKVAQKLRSKIRSSILSKKYVKTSLRSSNIIVRDSIYNILRRKSSPIVYRRRRRERKVTLLIDISGSMRTYAENAILLASAFVKIVDNVLVFREYTVRVEKSTIRFPEKMVKFLFNLKFGGWTNISEALNEARRLRSKTVVLISDLKQTVLTEKPSEKARELLKSGAELIVITPPVYDKTLAQELEFLGAKVVHIKEAQDLVKVLSFIL